MRDDLLFTYQHVSPKAHSPRITLYTKELSDLAANPDRSYPSAVHALFLPSDAKLHEEVKRVAKSYWTNQLRYVVVIGIGGSNLGTQAILEALRGTHGAYTDTLPKVLFADTTDTRALDELLLMLTKNVRHREEIVLNLISKSGTTTESIANFEYLYAGLTKHLLGLAERVVVTTDRGGVLWKAAEKRGFGLLSIPKEVGGRFSVFSSVGLFPLALAGIDIDALTKGADDCLRGVLKKENSALRAAEVVFRAREGGVSILNFFFFNPELEGVGKWCRQLYAESLGKEHDKSGKIVHCGFTPIVSIGSTDLHSMAQLYLGGPRDKFTFFHYVPGRMGGRIYPETLGGLVPDIEGKTPGAIMGAIYRGVKASYDKHKLPYGEVHITEISPYGLGMYLMWHMIIVIYLGELLHVNVFNQPNVEDYKKATREILAAQSE